MPARRTPVGASSARALSDMRAVYTEARRRAKRTQRTALPFDRLKEDDTMKITDVSLTLFAWDDIPPTQYGQHSRFAGSSALGLLRIATDDGVEGHAFLGSASNSAAIDGQGLITHLKPMLMGRNPMHREALVVDLWKRQRPAGVRTIGAVDVALWDLLGKAVGQPIHRLLGTYRESRAGLCQLRRPGVGQRVRRAGRRVQGERLGRLQDPSADALARGHQGLRGGAQRRRRLHHHARFDLGLRLSGRACASAAPSRRWTSTGTKTRSPTRTSTIT